MKREFSMILEDCLQSLRNGQTVEACLKQYPQQAKKLRPLLMVANSVQTESKIQPHPEAYQTGRLRMLASARQHMMNSRRKPIVWNLAFKLAIGFCAVILAASIITINASANSLPGDFLYGLKLGWETAHLNMTFNAQSRQALETQFAFERFNEVRKLQQSGRHGDVKLSGVLESVRERLWTVNGLTMLVDSNTIIEGTITTGCRLTLRAQVRSNGQIYLSTADFRPCIGATPGTFSPNITPQPPGNSISTDDTDADDTTTLKGTPEPVESPESTEDVEPTEEVEPTEVDEPTEKAEPMDDVVPTYYFGSADD